MTDKTQLEVSLLIPSVHDKGDACIERLSDLLRAKAGIEDAHPKNQTDDSPGQICIHFDPARISLQQVRELAGRVGAELDERYGHLTVKTSAMNAHKAQVTETKLRAIPGVLQASVSPIGAVAVEFDRSVTEEDKIQKELQKLGFNSAKEKKQPEHDHDHDGCEHKEKEHSAGCGHSHAEGGIFGEKTELVFAALCGLCLLVGWGLSFSNLPTWVPLPFYIAAYLFGGWYLLQEAISSIVSGRFEIDFLMLVAAAGAAILGEWAEGALLLFLFSIGHALEHYAMGKAKRAIEALAELTPQTAIVRRESKTEEIPLDQVKVGDTVLVKPNERLPSDGFVLKGEGSVNQAPITGESVPVDKQPVSDPKAAAENPDKVSAQSRVFAGTINGSGALEIQVTKLSTDSSLARVVQMVSEAETQKSPTQLFTDKFEKFFVPAILAFVVLLLFAGLVIKEPFSSTFYRAMAVLVAASPCALAIATPSAVLSSVARAARGGVLVKGGGPLEKLGTLTSIAFDKTGTLTEGKPKLTDTVPAQGSSEEELLKVAIAVEQLSDHPLAAAVVSGAKERLKGDSDLSASNVESITGRGVKATINGQPVWIGKDKLFEEIEGTPISQEVKDAVEKLKQSGRTTMVVRLAGKYLGVLGLMDTPRESAKEMIKSIRELGISQMIMLSGDNQQVADSVAKEVGIDKALGDLMPDDKVKSIRELSEKGGIAMVGDGVNDAPAMANATVGIAMGAAGSDVALETADVALMSDDLSQLPFAVGLSRQTSAVIKQNLWMSLGMIVFLVPATLLGLRMGGAVMLHEGSTVVVVFNALRLLAYQPKP